MAKAVVTGTLGQDGSYLSELLLEKGYEVYAVMRRSSTPKMDNIQGCLKNSAFHLVEGDITDPSSVSKIVSEVQPDEYYNLAAQSHVATSFEQPKATFDINFGGTLNALEAIRTHSKHTKFYQASTSEMFGQNYKEITSWRTCPMTAWNPSGKVQDKVKVQDESVNFAPRSPYGVSKLAAHELVRVYRESYKIYACCGILFNHESPRRGYNFVTRKITKWIGKFANQFSMELNDLDIFGPLTSEHLHDHHKLKLGNLKAVRDWGHAKDYVRAMYLMLQQSKPDDYVVATGESHTVEDFLVEAFKYVHPELDYRNFVVVDPAFYRPCEVDHLHGRALKAKEKLGWEPEISFQKLVHEMVSADMKWSFDNGETL